MSHRSIARTLCVALTLAGLVGLPAGAAELSTMSTYGSGIAWSPEIRYDGVVLTVSGEGRWARWEFGPGETPIFVPYDVEGNRFPDGHYTWQLTYRPQGLDLDPSEFENSRSNSDGSAVTHGRAPERLVEGGSFAIQGGAIVDPSLPEGGFEEGGDATEDQVILDDLIVDGSACVGFDCVNGESFGFDTIRLKENNLRIKFQDTSTAGGFPSNDWQLTANDSSNGGANKFSIDDIDGGRTPFTIEAGAPSHSLYVDDGGRVGMGTSTPVVEVHVVDGDSPTLRLAQDGSSGFAAQTWDVAGNETNFFVRDATNGSTLPFKIRPGAPSNALYLNNNGNVGIGTASPDAPLDVDRSHADGANPMVLVQDSAATAGNDMLLKLDSAGGAPFMQFESTFGDWDFVGGNFFVINDPAAAGNEFQLDRTGNLTIGGDINTSSCAPCVSDYVFEPGYELMPLDELERFIEENKHLPNVISESEAQAQGYVSVNKLQVTLLEKIEELTLYTIAQQKTIDELQEKLESLEADRR